MNTEQVLEILYQLGFQPEKVEDSVLYKFEYETWTLLLVPEEDENECVRLMLPGIFDITEDNRGVALEAMAELCGRLKYIQPVILGDSVWLNYQHYLAENKPTPELIEHMIQSLCYATIQFNQIIH